MPGEHPYKSKVEPHPIYASRFRWTIFAAGHLRESSGESYATRREAEIGANKRLKQLIEAWRIRKRPHDLDE
jgi:hypothetical protein